MLHLAFRFGLRCKGIKTSKGVQRVKSIPIFTPLKLEVALNEKILSLVFEK